jgi:hypothetical protein
VVLQEQEEMSHVEIAGLMKRDPEQTFETLMVPLGEILSDRGSSDYGEYGEDEEVEATEQGKMSKDDEPGWVMGTITRKIQQRTNRFQQKQTNIDELTNWDARIQLTASVEEMRSTDHPHCWLRLSFNRK